MARSSSASKKASRKGSGPRSRNEDRAARKVAQRRVKEVTRAATQELQALQRSAARVGRVLAKLAVLGVSTRAGGAKASAKAFAKATALAKSLA